MKPIVLIPTFNEKGNISELIHLLREEMGVDLPILVVDSASPDGTAQAVRELQQVDRFLHLLEQPAKLGLGCAYLDGMDWVLKRDYDCLITMDTDFSHHPRYLPLFLKEIDNADLVIGTRYIPGGELRNWPASRRMLSRFANWYARTLMGLPFSDMTSGFHCFRTLLLKRILRYRIHTEGYAFLMELKFLAIAQGARYREVPIIFSDRTYGDSKISKRVILESMLFVLQRMFYRKRTKQMAVRNQTLASSPKSSVLARHSD